MRRIPVAGGSDQRLAAVECSFGGATWSEDGSIYFSENRLAGDADNQSRLRRVDETGGVAEAVAGSEFSDGVLPWAPFILPGSEALLVTVRHGSGGMYYAGRVEACELK